MNRSVRLASLALALCASAGVAPLHAHDGGDALAFPPIAAAPLFKLSPSGRAGEVLWESGPSQAAPARFEAVLVQGMLKGLRDSDLAIEAAVRTSSGWSDWTAGTIVECYPNGRFWARVRLSGSAGDIVRLRAVSRGPTAGGTLEIFGIETKPSAEDSSQVPADQEGFRFDDKLLKNASSLPPGVLPREAWNAKPIKPPHRFEPMHALRLTVHHTEGAQPLSREEAMHELQAIQSFHQNGRGWNDIAYHFLIDGTGQVWQGRPEGAVGSHVLARNDGSIGISMMGSFHPPKNQKPTEAQLRSLVALLRSLSARHQIPVARIFGHRQQEPPTKSTDCPGNILFAMLPEIRTQVAQGSVAPAVDRASAPLRVDGPAMRTLLEVARP